MNAKPVLNRIFGAILLAGCSAVAVGAENAREGGFVLQFDDGWSSWRTVIAPQLARVGGRATGFVNNQYIRSGRISLEDLRTLQDAFGWEVGSHSYNHLNAVRYVQQHGLDEWLSAQFDRSVSELRGAGLRIGNFVFPFNAFSPELGRAVRERGMGSYRQADVFALAPGCRADGAVPGTSIDLTRYLPIDVLKQWVDMAHERRQYLLLYGHSVLPDAAFVTGRVARVTAHELVAESGLTLPSGDDVVLVPDIARRCPPGSVARLTLSEDRCIRISDSGPDLTRLTAPGSTFLIGPAYGTRTSDFEELIRYASERLKFFTVSEMVTGAQSVGSERRLP